MKFIELKEQIVKGVTPSELINFKYVSLVSQQIMAEDINTFCIISDKAGFKKINYTLKSLFKSLYILANYTDIEFEGLYDNKNKIDSDLAIEFYDFCQEHGINDYVLKNCKCNEFIVLLEKEIAQEIELNNSVASILSKALNTVISKLPSQIELGNVLKEIPNIIASFNKPKATPTPRKKKV